MSNMRADLREICQREIDKLNHRSIADELDNDDINKLQKLVSSLKMLEESKTPEVDNIEEIMRVATPDQLLEILRLTEGD